MKFGVVVIPGSSRNDEMNQVSDIGIKGLKDHSKIIFRYCDVDENVTAQTNVNGSVESMSSICNVQRNGYEIMVRPEYASKVFSGSVRGKKLIDLSIQSWMPNRVYKCSTK